MRMTYSRPENIDDSLMKACFIISALCLVYPPTTQYMVLIVPFLAFWLTCRDSRYMLSWKIMAVGSIIYVFASNALTIMPLAVWTDLIGIDTLMAIFDWFNTTCIGPISMRSLQFIIGGVIQCIGVLSVFYLMYGDRLRGLRRNAVERTGQ